MGRPIAAPAMKKEGVPRRSVAWGLLRGGRASKIRGLTDHLGSPIGLELTAAQHSDAAW